MMRNPPRDRLQGHHMGMTDSDRDTVALCQPQELPQLAEDIFPSLDIVEKHVPTCAQNAEASCQGDNLSFCRGP